MIGLSCLVAALSSSGGIQNQPAEPALEHKTLPQLQLFVYSKAEQGGHFLMFKDLAKFTSDLRGFMQLIHRQSGQNRLAS